MALILKIGQDKNSNQLDFLNYNEIREVNYIKVKKAAIYNNSCIILDDEGDVWSQEDNDINNQDFDMKNSQTAQFRNKLSGKKIEDFACGNMFFVCLPDRVLDYKSSQKNLNFQNEWTMRGNGMIVVITIYIFKGNKGRINQQSRKEVMEKIQL